MQQPLAQTTIDNIIGELGDPEEVEEGTIKIGTIRGQIVKQLTGGTLHEPHIIDYEAKAIKKDGKLQWEIINWRVVV